MKDADILRAFIGAAFAGNARCFRRDGVIEALERMERDHEKLRAAFLDATGWTNQELLDVYLEQRA